jgi:hypothetical protein
MKLKTVEVDGNTYAEVMDGKPVYVDDAGKDVAFDAPHARETITRLNGEAKGHREAKEAAEAKLKGFEGISDPAAALKAMETVAALDGGKIMDAEKAAAERQKAVEAAVATYKQQLEAATAERDTAAKALHAEKIGGGFARSQFIAEKMAVPVQMVEATFGRHFSIEDGKIVAKDANGNPIYSGSRPGEPADFDEALETLVNASPYRDSVLKGRGHAGSGARPGGGAGAKTITRAEFEQKQTADPAGAAKMMSEGYTLTD